MITNIEKFKNNENLEPDQRYAKQISYLQFNKEGNLRGFGFGFSPKDYNKFAKEFAKDQSIIIFVPGGLFPKNLPHEYFESYYWKSSKNNDLQKVLSLMPFQF